MKKKKGKKERFAADVQLVHRKSEKSSQEKTRDRVFSTKPISLFRSQIDINRFRRL